MYLRQGAAAAGCQLDEGEIDDEGKGVTRKEMRAEEEEQQQQEEEEADDEHGQHGQQQEHGQQGQYQEQEQEQEQEQDTGSVQECTVRH